MSTSPEAKQAAEKIYRLYNRIGGYGAIPTTEQMAEIIATATAKSETRCGELREELEAERKSSRQMDCCGRRGDQRHSDACSQARPDVEKWEIKPVEHQGGSPWPGLAYVNGKWGALNEQVAIAICSAHNQAIAQARAPLDNLLKEKLIELAQAHVLLDMTKDELAARVVFHAFESKDYYCQFCSGRGNTRQTVAHQGKCLLLPFPAALTGTESK